MTCWPAGAQQAKRPGTAGKSLAARVEALEARVQQLEKRLDAGGGVTGGMAPRISMDESPVTVKLISKSFHEGDLLTGEVGDRIGLELEFTSDLTKPVRAFTGVVMFRDVFDREVLRASLTCGEPMRPRQSIKWVGMLGYQQFDENHRRLRNLGVKELETDFVLERVIYADGSRAVFAEPEETKSVQNKLLAAARLPAPKATGSEGAGAAAGEAAAAPSDNVIAPGTGTGAEVPPIPPPEEP